MSCPVRVLFVLCLGASVFAQAAPRVALHGFDPVELTRGREVAGDPEQRADRGPFRYQFATRDSLAEFQREPQRYEIQLGGGCGRMGPRSGKGDPGRFFVHEGRTYVFASEQCRTAFAKDPPRFLDPDVAKPVADAAGAQRAAELLAKAVTAIGGAPALEQVTSYRALRESTADDRGTRRRDSWELTVAFPGSIRIEEASGDWRFSTVVTRDAAFTIGNSGNVEDLHTCAVSDVWRDLRHQPLWILRACGAAGFVAAATGTSKLGDATLEQVTVWCDGTSTVLGIDPESGRIRQCTYRGRGPHLWYGTLQQTFHDFEPAGALVLPRRTEVTFDGKDEPALASTWSELVVNAPVAAKTFERPR